MSLVKNKKYCKCKKFHSDIWMNNFKYTQQKGALCFDCGSKINYKSIFDRFINWLTKHGE